MKVTMLGCGTSVGVPALGQAGWGKCDPEDKPKHMKTALVASRINTLLSLPMLLTMVVAQNLY